MSGVRIVIVTLSEPYPFGHVLGRWYYALLKELSRRQYQVRCLSSSTNQRWAELAADAVKPLGVELSVHPVEDDRHWFSRKWRTFRRPFSHSISNSLRARLASEIRFGYDILHFEQLWSGYLAEQHPRTLVGVHHLSSLDLKALKPDGNPRFRFDRYLMRQSESRLLRRLSVVTTLSDRLAASIQAISPRTRVFVVPFGLDPSLYQFNPDDRSDEPTIGFLANMRWMPGYLAARRLITRIFPLVKHLVPNTRLFVAGWDARAALPEFIHNAGVTISENVPDPQATFDRLQVLAYPVPQGSGVKVKVLEAMAWGIPVVTTTDGVEGIEAVDGKHCHIADNDELFAQLVANLLQQDDLRRSFRLHARALVEEQHSPAPIVNRLEQVYKTL